MTSCYNPFGTLKIVVRPTNLFSPNLWKRHSPNIFMFVFVPFAVYACFYLEAGVLLEQGVTLFRLFASLFVSKTCSYAFYNMFVCFL